MTVGDTDFDGDMDVAVSLKGAFSVNPSPAGCLRNPKRATPAADTVMGGLDTMSGPGRSPRVVDVYGDGDLDLILLNFVIRVGSWSTTAGV